MNESRTSADKTPKVFAMFVDSAADTGEQIVEVTESNNDEAKIQMFIIVGRSRLFH